MFQALLPLIGMAGGKLLEYIQARKAAKFNPVLKRVQDAKAAGVHPVTALGATGLDSPPAQIAFAESFSKAGQQIGSALDRNQDHDQKALKAALLEKAGLENTLLRQQIAAEKTKMATPTLPSLNQKYLIEGQGPTAIPNVPGTIVEVPGAHKIEQPQYTTNLSVGFPYRTNPRFSDMQSFEDRYGDSDGGLLPNPGFFYAWTVWAADHYKLMREAQERAHTYTQPQWENLMSRLKASQARRPGGIGSR